MSTSAATLSTPLASTVSSSTSSLATKALGLGLAGIAATAAGLFMADGKTIGLSWLVGLSFWIGIAIGMLFLVMIHHIFDASWSVVLRRQFEHGLAAFPWLLLLFVPLIVVAWSHPHLIWKWMDPTYDLTQIGGEGTVGEDVLWTKKAGFLNVYFFTFFTLGSFLSWIFLSSRFRRNSFTQDTDGDIKWTTSSRKWSAGGLALTALTMTGAVILWIKSLDYHWFSTMFGVWYFAGAVRAALAVGVILLVWLWKRGDLKGVLNNNHLHSIGQLMFAFTVFWAYVTFSQYFLIWNANIPEETFWYNLREMNLSTGEFNQWGVIGMFLLFGHFLLPFLVLVFYKVKLSKVWMPRVAGFIAFVVLIDIIYNIMPSKKTLVGDAYPFFSSSLLWIATSVIGIGGVCFWAYLKSFGTTKLIPIRDPRITECLTHHE